MSDEPKQAALPPDWPAESAQRLEKAAQLRALGIDPYPTRYERTHRLAEIVAAYGDKSMEELATLGVPVRIAGRVLTKRGHGKASFATLQDGSTRLQIYVRQEDVGERGYRLFDLVDLGDFLGVAGVVMRTRKGELSVQARELTFLSKALLPPPEKWHGLADVEQRYRQRHLDLLANPEVRRTFLARSALVAELRRFLEARGYVEVETPMMQAVPGGAVARPFVTHHNALGIDLYLRIAPELYLKRLVVGGLERVYELNRSFRNEGIDSQHNPEFTMLEFYTAYADCRDVIGVTEELIGVAADRLLPGGGVEYTDRTTGSRRTLSFARPFRRLSMRDALAEFAEREGWGLRRESLAEQDELVGWLRSRPAPPDASNAERAREWTAVVEAVGDPRLSHGARIALLFDELVSRKLWEPTFVTDYPVEVSPLAKKRAEDPLLTDRFELFAAGMEIANGFSELNDPLDQRERFLQQLRARLREDQEAHPLDDDYVRALAHGLPPTGGCGVGIDRLAMILTDSASIRDVILFPHMRPEAGRAQGPSGSEA